MGVFIAVDNADHYFSIRRLGASGLNNAKVFCVSTYLLTRTIETYAYNIDSNNRLVILINMIVLLFIHVLYVPDGSACLFFCSRCDTPGKSGN